MLDPVKQSFAVYETILNMSNCIVLNMQRNKHTCDIVFDNTINNRELDQ